MSVNWSSRFYNIFTVFLLFFFITTFCYSFEVGQTVRIKASNELARIVKMSEDETNVKILDLQIDDLDHSGIKYSSVEREDRVALFDPSDEIPTILLIGNISEGVGDLIHLEEYTKFLRFQFGDRVKIYAVTSELSHLEKAKSRAALLQDQYHGLGLFASSSTMLFIQKINELQKSADIVFSISMNPRENLLRFNPSFKLFSRSYSFNEYGLSGPYRFYFQPGSQPKEMKDVFHRNLAKEAPFLLKTIEYNDQNNRAFLPADARSTQAALVFLQTFSKIYHSCDFYLPSRFLTKDFKKEVRKIDSSKKWEFITPDSTIALSVPKPNSIRIFSSFPLSDETYRGLYFFTKGDVVGYGGDDGFSLALSSGKLPFPLMTRSERTQRKLIESLDIGDPNLGSYLKRAYNLAVMPQDDVRPESLRDRDDVQALREQWMDYATKMFENPERNGFEKMKNIVQAYIRRYHRPEDKKK